VNGGSCVRLKTSRLLDICNPEAGTASSRCALLLYYVPTENYDEA